VGKRRSLQEHKALAKGPVSAQERLQVQLQTLIEQKKYRQALDRFKQIHQTHPEIQISPSEAEIWVLQGKQEFNQKNYRQAGSSFRQALNLGLVGEAHYWIAKSLLALEQFDEALAEIRNAFEGKVLPKEYAGCYLKLLFHQGDSSTVTQLISKQSKRFLMPQVHWARGILALQAKNFKEALAHFQKMGRPATPGDTPMAWMGYTHQQAGNWAQAGSNLGIRSRATFSLFQLSPTLPKHPAMQRLAVMQAIGTKQPVSDVLDLDQKDLPQRDIVLCLDLLQSIDDQDFHHAGHVLLQLGHPCHAFPEVNELYESVLRMAGEQSLKDDEPDCTEAFWGDALSLFPFNPQLAYKLQHIYDQNESYRDRERLLNRLIEWLKQEAKKNPQDWPEPRLPRTQTNLLCKLADNFMAMGQSPRAIKTVQEAERIFPTSPEVKGRQGLQANMQEGAQKAIPILTQALEEGCKHLEVYQVLLNCLNKTGDRATIKTIQQRFGPQFGDMGTGLEFELPAWVEVLATQNYEVFEQLSLEKTDKDPALTACRIFVEATEDDLNKDGRITFDLTQATKQWDRLLQAQTPQSQISVLQAIILSMELFAKRKKGLTALMDRYRNQLIALGGDYPQAKEANIVLSVVKGLAIDRLRPMIQFYLDAVSQTGTALAKIQLQARRFVQTDLLSPFIEDALRREPQNPQLLLAKATTFPLESKDYTKFREQGFELARRLQDAQALQAFREEEAFQAGFMAQDIFPDLLNLGTPGGPGMEDIVRKMAQKMFGKDVPPAMLEQMLPELMRMMANEMPDFGEDDEEDDNFFGMDPFRFGAPFGPPPSRPKRGSRRKR
jgi:tetratricopeptide (TPR) repeat protein